MESILLVGTEEVRRAAHSMQAAAERMANVSSNMQFVFEAHQRFLNDWLLRFEQILAAGGTLSSSPDTKE